MVLHSRVLENNHLVMALLDNINNFLAGMTARAVPPPEGLAQDRYTHTPIYAEQPDDPKAMAQWHSYLPTMKTAQAVVGQSGVPTSQGYIQAPVESQSNPMYIRHEIIHALTSPTLDKDSSVYKQAQSMLPSSVNQQVAAFWKGIDYDPVHEGVAHFLASRNFSDPKWNDTKRKLINLFPSSSKGKLIRILSQGEVSPEGPQGIGQ